MTTLRAALLLLASAVLAPAAITYTCDPTIDARQTGLCNTLNTTIAGLYSKTFTNANAAIYITFGETGLGQSLQYLNYITWDQYLTALTNKANSTNNPIQKAAVAALNTYAAPLYRNGKVEITTSYGRSMGFSGMTGATKTGDPCTPGAGGCYDGIVTITNDKNTTLYFRVGTEPRDAFDFFGTVEHETNEVLGISSCIDTTGTVLVNSCDKGAPSAIDLYRYSGAGKLIAINSLSTTPGAYFSYDGGTTNGADGAPYSTLPNGNDYHDFASTCPGKQHVQDAQACAGKDGGVDITNDGNAEINTLTAMGYTPTAVVSAAPAISAGGVVSLGTSSTILQSGSWASIYGTNLAAASRIWKDSEIVNGNLPTSLDGVGVKINGKSAFIYYISPTQINFQVPDDNATGSVTVTLTNSNGTSNTSTATLASVGPAIFTLDGKYPAAVIPSATGVNNPNTHGAYDLLGPAGKFAFPTRPAKKGEIVAFYATGLGATSPATPAGKVVTGAAKTNNRVTVLIGGVSQTVDAYIIGAGTYQFNVTIPLNVATGDNAFTISINGVQTAPGTVVTVQ